MSEKKLKTEEIPFQMSEKKLKTDERFVLAYLSGAITHTVGNILYIGVYENINLDSIFKIIYSFIIWPLPALIFCLFFIALFSEGEILALVFLFCSSYLAFIITGFNYVRLKNK